MMKGGQPQQGSEAADVAMVRQWCVSIVKLVDVVIGLLQDQV